MLYITYGLLVNTFLNVGPTAEGVIPPESVQRLEAIGTWMDVNGEAIHGTDSSPFPRRLPWGRITRKVSANNSTSLYLHIWDWPADGKLLLPTLKELPTSGKLLKGGAAVTSQLDPNGLLVQVPGSATDPDISVVRLDFPGPLTITQAPYITASADGSLTLTAADADTHGGYAGNIKVKGSGPEAYLTEWNKPELRAEYQIRTENAGSWNVEAEVATEGELLVNFKVGKTSTPMKVAATGPGITWKTTTLGTVKLPAGECALELIPDKKAWNSLHLRKLRLTPVKE